MVRQLVDRISPEQRDVPMVAPGEWRVIRLPSTGHDIVTIGPETEDEGAGTIGEHPYLDVGGFACDETGFPGGVDDGEWIVETIHYWQALV
jgi:hypothetical protein